MHFSTLSLIEAAKVRGKIIGAEVQHFGENSAFGRPGQPAEIAPAFVFLATGESTCMTGETIGVTGGSPVA